MTVAELLDRLRNEADPGPIMREAIVAGWEAKILAAVAFEVTAAWLYAHWLADGEALNDDDRARLTPCARRLRAADHAVNRRGR